ncbi:MAG: rod shape-determining protein MreC [Clostridia bacterium]
MKDFFSSIFFKVVVAIFALSLGAAAYTFSFSGTSSLATTITGTLLSPLQTTFSNITIFMSNVYTKSFEFDEVMEENERLKQQVSELSDQARLYEYALTENEHLKEILEISEVNQTYEFEICEIVGKDFSNTSSVLTLDKGTSAGIELNDCVITADGLVGYITRVGLNFSQVTTVLDPTFTMGTLISRSREIGVCEGNLELLEQSSLKLTYLDKNADVLVGDTVESSGITGIYPKGIAIGTISAITTETNGISKYTIIEPFVDVDEINQVYIIKSF